MATILVDAAGATAGGGANYLRRLVEGLAHAGQGRRFVVLAPADGGVASQGCVEVRTIDAVGGALARFDSRQSALRRLVRTERADLLLATGNFGLLAPPIPQVLWNRNALYFSTEHLRRLASTGQAREIARTLWGRRRAALSIRSSRLNLTPTHAFRRQILRAVPSASAERFFVLPFGVDAEELRPVRGDDSFGFSARSGAGRVLLVSHYNPFRNFETLIRAAAILRRRGRRLEFVLTTHLGRGLKDHRYDTSGAYRLAHRLGVLDSLTMLGPVHRRSLGNLYAAADLVVCPSYAESFGHPLVEAMAAGRPIVASDQPVHRELCREAAVYFSTFDAEQLADRLAQTLEDPARRRRLIEAGRSRAAQFCWKKHFASLTSLLDAALAERNWNGNSCTTSKSFSVDCR